MTEPLRVGSRVFRYEGPPKVDYRVLSPGLYSLIVRDRSYEVTVRENGGGWVVEVDGHRISVSLAEKAKVPVRSGVVSAPVAVCSPMPGRVVGIRVKEGDSVREGEGVVVVEAMKMENELQAARAGRIVRLSVKVGDKVEAGQELVVID